MILVFALVACDIFGNRGTVGVSEGPSGSSFSDDTGSSAFPCHQTGTRVASASAWLAGVVAPSTGQVSWSTGETGAASLGLDVTGVVSQNHYSHDANGEVPATEDGDCPDLLAVPVQATLHAGDHGELDETFTTTILGDVDGPRVLLHGTIPVENVGGTLRPQTIDLAAFPGTWLDLGLARASDGWTGSVDWLGSNDVPADTAEPAIAEVAGNLSLK